MARLNRPQLTLNRKLLAIVTTTLVLLVLLLYLRPQDYAASQSTTIDEPESCLTVMLQTAQNGNGDAYVKCFAGNLQNKLKSRLAGRPVEQVAAELRGDVEGLTGQTTTNLEFQSRDQATLLHERLYTDEKEVYRARLQRIESEWRIVELKSLGRVALEIPVGTPVFVPPPSEEEQPADDYKRPQPVDSGTQSSDVPP